MKTSYKYKNIRNVISQTDENAIDFLYTYKDCEYVKLKDVLSSNLSIESKLRFVLFDCALNRKNDNLPQLTLNERKELMYTLCESILPIYQTIYPSDTRVENCLKAYNDFRLCKITKDEYKPYQKECYNACSDAHRREEFGFAYSVSYAIQALDRDINDSIGDGLSKIIDSIKFDKSYEEKALEILKSFFSIEFELTPEEDTIITKDSVIDDVLFNTPNIQSTFDGLDEKFKIVILTELIDTLNDNPRYKLTEENNKNIMAFLKANKKILKKLTKFI